MFHRLLLLRVPVHFLAAEPLDLVSGLLQLHLRRRLKSRLRYTGELIDGLEAAVRWLTQNPPFIKK